MLSTVVPVLRRDGEMDLADVGAEQLMTMSAATIDRRLAAERARIMVPRGRSHTKSGSLLKSQIPIRTWASAATACLRHNMLVPVPSDCPGRAVAACTALLTFYAHLTLGDVDDTRASQPLGHEYRLHTIVTNVHGVQPRQTATELPLERACIHEENALDRRSAQQIVAGRVEPLLLLGYLHWGQRTRLRSAKSDSFVDFYRDQWVIRRRSNGVEAASNLGGPAGPLPTRL